MIGKRIRTLREEQGISQADLAAKLNVSRMTLNNYENEKRVPDIEFAIDAANYFGVTVEFLSGRTEFRGRDDMDVSLKKVEGLFRAMEKLPQPECQSMISNLIETLDKAVEMEMSSNTLYVLNNCCIQMREILFGYEKLQKSIVSLIVELKCCKMPESQIRLATQDKPRAIYDAAFHVVNTIGDTANTCAKAMIQELHKSIDNAIGK